MKTKLLLIFFLCLFTANITDASEILQLTDGTESNGFPQWSPDGEKIVYYTLEEGNIGDTKIWVMDSDGSNKTQLTSGKSLGPIFLISGYSTTNQPWSPNGNKILYGSLLGLDVGDFPIPLKTDIRIMDANGTSKKKVKGASNAESYEWIQNGTKIFMVDRSKKLWLLNLDGTDKVLLAQGAGNDSLFLWQPYGNIILYASKECDNYDLWLMNSDGSGKKQLTSTPENENDMGWSPDGEKIIYTSKSFRDKTNYSTYHDTSFNYSETIWIMDADGTNKKQLTAPNRNWDSSPQWSPDGTKIVFQRMDVGTPFNIAVMNDDGSNLTILTTNGSIDISPQWSPKGDKIAFMSSKDGKFTISVIVLDEELASGPAAYVPDNIQKSPEKTPGFGSAIAIFMLFMLGKNMRKVN